MASFWKIMGPLIRFIADWRTGASIGLALGYAEDTKAEQDKTPISLLETQALFEQKA